MRLCCRTRRSPAPGSTPGTSDPWVIWSTPTSWCGSQPRPTRTTARRAVEALEEDGLYAASQNFVELWNVITRPVENNGLGQPTLIADHVLGMFEQAFSRLPEPAESYECWRDLVVQFSVSGVKVHDTRLVALMLVNDILRILTFNANDFRRYEALGIRAIDPREV